RPGARPTHSRGDAPSYSPLERRAAAKAASVAAVIGYPGAAMARPFLPPLLSRRLPVFYGWIVLASLCCAGFARQGPAVATLSIFVEPLTREFGWSRTALSGAVSLGGVLAAISAPLIGPLLDRRGSRLVVW